MKTISQKLFLPQHGFRRSSWLSRTGARVHGLLAAQQTPPPNSAALRRPKCLARGPGSVLSLTPLAPRCTGTARYVRDPRLDWRGGTGGPRTGYQSDPTPNRSDADWAPTKISLSITASST